MKYFIDDHFALSRPPEGPVASYVIPFAQWLVDRGYGLVSTRNQVLMAAGFSKWLWQKGIELGDISGDHPGRYLLDLAQRPKLGDNAALQHLLVFLRSHNAIAEEIEADHNPSPVEQHVLAYEHYLRDARALSRQTIINYRPVVRDFLNFRFSDGKVSLTQLRAVDVVNFVQDFASQHATRQDYNHRTAIVSLLCAVSWGHHVRPGGSGPDRSQLVAFIYSSRDRSRRGGSIACQHRSRYARRMPRLCDNPRVGAIGITVE